MGKSMKNPDGSVLRFEQLPDWLKDNDFLIAGHRAPTNSFLECFKSIFKIHTETVNIWTHLIGFTVSVLTTMYFLSLPLTELHWQEKLVFSAFFAGALATFGCSSGFHIFCCHSEYVGKAALKFDYSGIVLGTVGSFLPWIYYLFHGSLISQIVYTVVIGLLGTACFYVSMWDTFAEAKFRHIRAGLFIGFGLSGVVPLTHYLINDGLWNAFQSSGIEWIFVMGAFYIIGTVTYALRIPERFWPGHFDILFSSHQIFHVCVCIAVAVDFYGIQQTAKYRLNCGCCTKDFKMAITKLNMDAIINTTLGWNHVRMTC